MKIIRLAEVMGVTGLSRSTIYRFMAKGGFPKRVTLGERSVGWIEAEVSEWIASRIQARDVQHGDA